MYVASSLVYFKQNGSLQSHPLCYISNDLQHDVDFVYKVVAETIQFIKTILVEDLYHAYYFTDGCSGQYKNRKNFINLSHHYEDFGVTATWSFFATHHGKSPCDGLGGTIKKIGC